MVSKSDSLPDVPLITLAIVSYNAEGTLPRAIDSALAQTWSRLEIIVIDDCSSDRSFTVATDYARLTPQFNVSRNDTNRGVAYCRQKAIELAEGSIIVFLDDDDEAHPERVHRQYSELVKAKEITGSGRVLCFGDRIVRDRDGKERFVCGIGRGTPLNGRWVANYILGGWRKPPGWGAAGAGTLCAEVAELRAIGFDPQFSRAAEVDLLVRAAIEGFSFVSPADFPVIVQHISQGAEKSAFSRCRNRWRLLKKHKAYIIANGLRLRSNLRFIAYVIATYSRRTASYLLSDLFSKDGWRRTRSESSE